MRNNVRRLTSTDGIRRLTSSDGIRRLTSTDGIVEWLNANIKAIDPLQPIRDWMEDNPMTACSYGKN